MARITEESVARIKDSIDIVELVGRYVELRRAGNSWKACCPFHAEKTPSFHVNPARQTFHCFGCGVGGSGIQFLMMYENLDYPTALRRIADMNGIAVIEEEESPEMIRQRHQRSRIVEANQLATEYFHRKLCRDREAGHVREYLQSREFNIDIAKAWQLGWAPPDFREFQQIANSKGFDHRTLTDAYLLGQGQRGSYPVFRDRLMFPIHNIRGEVVGFSGRVMQADQDPRKYVNTSETVAFRKGELLFGLFKATSAIGKANMTVVVCEGQLDVIACHEKADIRNAVAGLGTAFTEEHAKILRKYAKRAILCYDGDNAGIKASEKTYRKLVQAGLDVHLAVLPAGEDPDSLIRTAGPEALREAITNARPYLEVRAGQELARVAGDPAGRATIIPLMADLASEITDPIRRDVAVTDLATRLNTGLDDLRNSVRDIIKARKDAPPPSVFSPISGPDVPEEDYEEPSLEDEPIHAAEAIRLHPSIKGLAELVISNAQAQHLLLEQMEDLQEPIDLLPGGIILLRLLEHLPQPGNDEDRERLLNELPPAQAAALRELNWMPLPELDAAAEVARACDRASRDSILVTIDTLRSRIRSSDISREEGMKLMQECLQLQKLLNN